MKCGQCKKRDVSGGRGGRLCEECRNRLSDTKRKQQEQRKQAGLCVQCGQQPDNGNYCRLCFLKKIAGNRLKDTSRYVEIGTLLEGQNSRCAYTGLPLVLGVNASIDHIIPRSRGGTHDTNNLQWVDMSVNRMRGATPDAEFREFIKKLRESLNHRK